MVLFVKRLRSSKLTFYYGRYKLQLLLKISSKIDFIIYRKCLEILENQYGLFLLAVSNSKRLSLCNPEMVG